MWHWQIVVNNLFIPHVKIWSLLLHQRSSSVLGMGHLEFWICVVSALTNWLLWGLARSHKTADWCDQPVTKHQFTRILPACHSSTSWKSLLALHTQKWLVGLLNQGSPTPGLRPTSRSWAFWNWAVEVVGEHAHPHLHKQWACVHMPHLWEQRVRVTAACANRAAHVRTLVHCGRRTIPTPRWSQKTKRLGNSVLNRSLHFCICGLPVQRRGYKRKEKTQKVETGLYHNEM